MMTPLIAITTAATNAAQSSASGIPVQSATVMPIAAASGGDRVRAVVPGVGAHRAALDLGADREHRAEERLLDHDHAEQHDQGERRRQVMRDRISDRTESDESRRPDQQRPTAAAAIDSALP